MDFKDKCYVVTGASGGMGTVLCTRLAEKGAKLAICSNDSDALFSLKEKIKKDYGREVFASALDITDETQVENFFTEAKAFLGKFDGLVNLAGVSIPAKIEEMAEKSYDTTIDVNLKGTFLACKKYLPLAGVGSVIVNLGSMAARRANGNAPLYCTAKAAVNMFSQGLAIQAAARDVRVTVLNPGGADTGFWGDRPVNRAKFMQPSEVVDVIEFVLSLPASVAVHSIDFESFAAMK